MPGRRLKRECQRPNSESMSATLRQRRHKTRKSCREGGVGGQRTPEPAILTPRSSPGASGGDAARGTWSRARHNLSISPKVPQINVDAGRTPPRGYGDHWTCSITISCSSAAIDALRSADPPSTMKTSLPRRTKRPRPIKGIPASYTNSRSASMIASIR